MFVAELSVYQHSEQYWLRCEYPDNLPEHCGRDEHVLQLAVLKDRIILQVAKANGERGKYTTSNVNRACNPEHYTYESEKLESAIITNL